jgi:hypothetical protein
VYVYPEALRTSLNNVKEIHSLSVELLNKSFYGNIQEVRLCCEGFVIIIVVSQVLIRLIRIYLSMVPDI